MGFRIDFWISAKNKGNLYRFQKHKHNRLTQQAKPPLLNLDLSCFYLPQNPFIFVWAFPEKEFQ